MTVDSKSCRLLLVVGNLGHESTYAIEVLPGGLGAAPLTAINRTRCQSDASSAEGQKKNATERACISATDCLYLWTVCLSHLHEIGLPPI